jgi:hypothetical protein
MRILALLLALPLAGCSGLLSFDIDSSGTSTIKGQPGGGLLGLGGLPGFSGFSNLNFSSRSEFQNNNTNKDHISQARITRLKLTVQSPAGADLSFLSKIDFFIEAPSLPKVHIAGKTPLPTGQGSVDLVLDDRDIAAYARSDSFTITTEVSGHAPTSDTTVRADLTLNVHATVL